MLVCQQRKCIHITHLQSWQIFIHLPIQGGVKNNNMDVKINSVNFTADRKLIDFINEKMQKLELMNDHIVSSEVFLKVDNGPSKENKIAEVKIHVPGNELFASKQCKSFEEGADMAVASLERQLKKRKEKLRSYL